MEVFQVTLPQQMLIKGLFGGFVFRQNKDGKHFIKVSNGQKKDIKKYLLINL